MKLKTSKRIESLMQAAESFSESDARSRLKRLTKIAKVRVSLSDGRLAFEIAALCLRRDEPEPEKALAYLARANPKSHITQAMRKMAEELRRKLRRGAGRNKGAKRVENAKKQERVGYRPMTPVPPERNLVLVAVRARQTKEGLNKT